MRRSSVARNYSHMTVAQLVATVISVCIYPYVIRVVGAEGYGWYVFAMAFANYFISFVSFGLKYPAAKAIVEYKDDEMMTNKVVSAVYVIKLCLTVSATFVFAMLVAAIPFLAEHKALMSWAFVSILSEMVLPQWFFQGRQQMHYVSYTAVACRLLSIPFIFLIVRTSADVLLYAVISSVATVLPSVIAMLVMVFKFRVRFVWVEWRIIKKMMCDAVPFLSTDAIGIIKSETATMLIGSYLGMRDVAVYDLAVKIVSIPRMFIQNVNHALFPAVVAKEMCDVRRILRYETVVGLGMIPVIALMSYPAVLVLGGSEMLPDAVWTVFIVGLSIYTWLVVGAYIGFVFVPVGRYLFVTVNQLVALVSFVLFALPALLFYANVYTLSAAMTLSGLTEVLFCRVVSRKYKLL